MSEIKLTAKNVNNMFRQIVFGLRRNTAKSRLIKHSLLRIRERYNQNLTLIDYTKMLSLVQKDKVFPIADKTDKFNRKGIPLLIAAVPYKGKFYNVLYNRKYRLIATFLPKNVNGASIR